MATLDEKKAPSTEGSIPSLEKEKDNDSVQKHYVEGVDEIGHEIRALGPDVEEAMLAAESMSQEEVDDAIRYIVEEHGNDPNFPTRALELAKQYLYDDDVKNDTIAYRRLYDEAKVEAALVKYNSVYAEVRAVVSNKDDPTLPCLTIRTWIIGLIYVALGAFLNQFFSIRQPGITITSNVAQMLAYPVGKAMERVLPAWEINFFGLRYSLNPGHFNMKEHMLITIMANVGFSTPYTAYIIWVQFAPRFFNLPWAKNFGYQVLISLSTNFIGYGLAGVTRRFLVYPSHAIWPTNLAIIALNKAFHSNTNPIASGWKVSRMHFFLIAFTGMFIYFWFPNYIFQALSYFNWMTWISPNNVMLAAVTGGVTGLGFNPIPTFDWNILTFEADPIVYPFFTVVNFFLGALFTLPIIIAVWVHNVWFTAYLPINSNGVFDNTGNRYNISLAVDSNGLFDVEAYKQYSPAYLACANILLYGFFFAAYAATISHAYLYHRREIANGFRHLWRGKTLKDIGKYDIHVRLMSAYPEVSEWWYFGVLVFSIVVGAIGVAVFPTSTSPAVVLYGVLLAAIFCVPIGIIQAITNAQVTLNVLAEFFGGLWFPGNANALNFFKSYGYVTTAHTLSFAQDLKLAHYTHIPPFATFWAQMVATLASTFVSIGILNFQMTQIVDVCSPTQKDRFTCPGQNTFFTASVLWGTLGPARMFGSGAIYNGLIWCFLIGFLLPFFFYYLRRWFPITRYFHLPVFFLGALIWAPFNISFIWPAVPIAWFFSVYIKRRHLDWWSKYAYILSAAFACGIAISGIIQFFAVQFHEVDIVWGGNTIPYDGCDGNACTLLTVPDGGHFGPGVGEFS